MLASDFKDLTVYQKAVAAEFEIFVLSKTFPFDERFSLTDQVRRSSRAIGAQIAEAWAKRRYPAHFISKLSDADAECNETRHWLDAAVRCGYLETAQIQPNLATLAEVSKMLHGMMGKADQFAQHRAAGCREEFANYNQAP